MFDPVRIPPQKLEIVRFPRRWIIVEAGNGGFCELSIEFGSDAIIDVVAADFLFFQLINDFFKGRVSLGIIVICGERQKISLKKVANLIQMVYFWSILRFFGLLK